MQSTLLRPKTDADWLNLDYAACAASFEYWLQHYGWMKDEQTGDLAGPGITLWPQQREYIDRYRNGDWLICGKARQVGLSWLATLADLHDVMFRRHVGVGVIAQNDTWAMFHLDRLRWVYNQQPAHIRRALPIVGKDNKHELGLSNGSSFAAYPCTESQGRGAARRRIRCEEYAFWEGDPAKVMAAVQGATRDHGQIVIISTGNGEGGAFAEEWRKAVDGQSKFSPVFLGWDARPDRPADFRAGMSAQLRQEWPATPDEMFLASGDKYFDGALLRQLEAQYCIPPIRSELATFTLGGVERSELETWVPPQDGHKYVIGADVADGGGDACSAVVLDARTGEECASYLSFTCGDAELGDVLYTLGMRYYGAALGVERNNNGAATLAILERLRYPNLTTYQDFDPTGKHIEKTGWLTSNASRPILLSDLREALKEGRVIMHSKAFYQQAREFGWYGNRWDHPKGGHDDCVISRGIAQQVRQSLGNAPDYSWGGVV